MEQSAASTPGAGSTRSLRSTLFARSWRAGEVHLITTIRTSHLSLSELALLGSPLTTLSFGIAIHYPASHNNTQPLCSNLLNLSASICFAFCQISFVIFLSGYVSASVLSTVTSALLPQLPTVTKDNNIPRNLHPPPQIFALYTRLTHLPPNTYIIFLDILHHLVIEHGGGGYRCGRST